MIMKAEKYYVKWCNISSTGLGLADLLVNSSSLGRVDSIDGSIISREILQRDGDDEDDEERSILSSVAFRFRAPPVVPILG